MKTVELRELVQNQLSPYFEELWEKYRSEFIGAGFSSEYADESVEISKKSIFPDGKLESGHFIFYAYSENRLVGNLWLATKVRDGNREWSIFDIETFSEYRGQGFGRAIMQAAEKIVRDAGGDSISLSVFGNNSVARNLYESLGYQTLRVAMKKTIL
jgi:ribosomal protein S18 acetylase RimI-like enzyme